MGLAALRKILAPEPLDPALVRGKALAVDADNLIWSFVTAIAGTGDLPKGPDGRSNAHLLGLANRLKLYANWGARTIWVFDGVQPSLKEATLIARAERAEAARVAGNAQASVWVGEEELAECRDLLTALGLPWIVSPGESDAQCADLVRRNAAWAAVTQDWDIALFGSPRALRNLTGSKTRTPEILDLAASLAKAGLTREQLVDAAILIGTDYNDGVSGVGPVKAIALVKKHGDLLAALAALGREIPSAPQIRDVFLRHPVDARFEPRFLAPDEGTTVTLLTDRGLGEKRARELVAAVSALPS